MGRLGRRLLLAASMVARLCVCLWLCGVRAGRRSRVMEATSCYGDTRYPIPCGRRRSLARSALVR